MGLLSAMMMGVTTVATTGSGAREASNTGAGPFSCTGLLILDALTPVMLWKRSSLLSFPRALLRSLHYSTDFQHRTRRSSTSFPESSSSEAAEPPPHVAPAWLLWRNLYRTTSGFPGLPEQTPLRRAAPQRHHPRSNSESIYPPTPTPGVMPTSFLMLPPELREKIYAELVSSRRNRHQLADGYSRYHFHLNIYRANRQIYGEARDVFRRQNVFVKIQTPWHQAEEHVAVEYVPYM